MALRKALVLVGGKRRELASPDALDSARVQAQPFAIAYATTIALDLAAHDQFTVAPLTGDVVFTVVNAAPGQRGYVWVQQDATGGRLVRFNITAPVVGNVNAASDLDAAATALAVTRYAYAVYLIGAVTHVDIDKSSRAQAPNVVTRGLSRVTSGGQRVVTA